MSKLFRLKSPRAVQLAKVDDSNMAYDAVMASINSLPGVLEPLAREGVIVRWIDLVNDRPWQDGAHVFRTKAVGTMTKLMRNVPVMVDHPIGKFGREAIPIGRTFDARLVRTSDENGPIAWNRVGHYFLNNAEGQGWAEKIDGGIITDGSVGIFFKTLECSVCQKPVDMYDGPTCKHRPGQKYENRLCLWEADDPELIDEWSLVYAGRIEGTHFRVAASGEEITDAVDVVELAKQFAPELKPERKPGQIFTPNRGEQLRKWFKGDAVA